jgi:hypothetical protein
VHLSKTKQLLNFLFFLRKYLFLGLFFIGLNLLAHADIQNQKDSQIENQIDEDHDTQNLDKLLIDYNKNQEKVLKNAAQFIPKESSSEITDQELELIQSTGQNDEEKVLRKKTKKKISPNLKKIKYSEALKVALEPLQKMSESELIKLLKDNTKDSSAADYINRFPKLAIFTVRLIKDKDALPNMAKILDDQDRLIHFAAIMITTMIFAFFLKYLMKGEGRSVFKALSFWFLRFLIISSLRIGIIFYFFSIELAPIVNITTKTFFRLPF